MRARLLSALALVPSFLLTSAPTAAQCGGNGGPAILEITTASNVPVGPGTVVTFRLIGTPGDHFCLLCDTDRGEVPLPPIGTICLGLTPNLAILSGVFPASGVFEATVTLPNQPGIAGHHVCCQTLNLNPTSGLISISNVVCLCTGTGCAGKLAGLSHVTALSYNGPYPVTVDGFIREKSATGTLLGQSVLTYSPVSRPNLPFTSDGVYHVENIAQVQGKLYVVSRIDAASLENGHLPSDTFFSVGAGGVTHSAKIHTSCSKPIGVGMVFGPFTITEIEDTEDPCINVCASGKPAALTFVYTGESCSASRNLQPAGKTSCSGDPGMTSPVFIRASDSSDPRRSARVWFEGTVALGDSFEIDARNAGQTSFASNTWMHVFADATRATLLQTVQVHTSCSAPLRIGDQFGSLRVTGFRRP